MTRVLLAILLVLQAAVTPVAVLRAGSAGRAIDGRDAAACCGPVGGACCCETGTGGACCCGGGAEDGRGVPLGERAALRACLVMGAGCRCPAGGGSSSSSPSSTSAGMLAASQAVLAGAAQRVVKRAKLQPREAEGIAGLRGGEALRSVRSVGVVARWQGPAAPARSVLSCWTT